MRVFSCISWMKLVRCALFLLFTSSAILVNAMQKEKNEPGELRAEILAGPSQENHYPLDDFLKNDAEMYRHVEVEFHEKMKGAVMKVINQESGEVRNKVDLTRFKTKIDLKMLFDKHGFVQDLSQEELKEKKIAKENSRRLKQDAHNDRIMKNLEQQKKILEQEIVKLKSYDADKAKINEKKKHLVIIEEKIKRVTMGKQGGDEKMHKLGAEF